MDLSIQSDLIRGNINTIILKALNEGDRYGYDIVREIEQKSGGQYHLKQPTLYSCLKRLEMQGFITSYWGNSSIGGRRKYFSLTDMGRELFAKSQDEWIYSRTIIDKLISNKTANLDEYIATEDSEASSGAGAELDAEPTQEEKENELDGAAAITENAAAQENAAAITENATRLSEEIQTITAILTDENTNIEQVKDHVAISSEPTPPAEKPIIPTTFLDTTEILNQLFSQQIDTKKDASYAEKLVTEKYVVDRTKTHTPSGESYFKDFYDDAETAQEPQLVTPPPKSSQEENLAPQEKQPTQNSAFVAEPLAENTTVLTDSQQIIKERVMETEPPIIEANKATDNDFHKYNEKPCEKKENIIDREYRNILGSFADNSFIDNRKKDAVAEPENNDNTEKVAATIDAQKESAATADKQVLPQIAAYTKDATVNKKLNKLAEEARQNGDNIKIRAHSADSSKEYTNKYYYYSNKLMLVHYGVLFCVMILEILASAIFVYAMLSAKRQPYDLVVYILAVLTALVFPTVAFIKNYSAPNKRKRINFSLKSSLIYRLIVMVQCMLVVYLVNVIFHMPLSFSMEYIVPVLLPSVLCTNFPLSALIFSSLFKSKKYAIIE